MEARDALLHALSLPLPLMHLLRRGRTIARFFRPRHKNRPRQMARLYRDYS